MHSGEHVLWDAHLHRIEKAGELAALVEVAGPLVRAWTQAWADFGLSAERAALSMRRAVKALR